MTKTTLFLGQKETLRVLVNGIPSQGGMPLAFE